MEENKDQLQPQENRPQYDEENISQPIHEAVQEQPVNKSTSEESGTSAFVPDQPQIQEPPQPDGLAFKNRIDLSELSKAVIEIKEQLRKVIIGQEEMIDLLIVSILANGHSLIEGVPGVAKTVTAKLLAKTCLLYTSPSPRDQRGSRMPSSA